MVSELRSRKEYIMKTPFSNLLQAPITDLRRVTMHWVTKPEEFPSSTAYLVHKDHVDRFVQACIKLHGDEGRNPHNGEITTKAEKIVVSSPDVGCYWWATPDLKKNEDYEKGAGIIDFWADKKVVWEQKKAPVVATS